MSWWTAADRREFTAICEREMPRMRTSKIFIPHYVERPNQDLSAPKRQTKRAYSDEELTT